MFSQLLSIKAGIGDMSLPTCRLTLLLILLWSLGFHSLVCTLHTAFKFQIMIETACLKHSTKMKRSFAFNSWYVGN